MKELCKRIMMFDNTIGSQTDYSLIAFLYWIIESNFINKKHDTVINFCKFLYRFYIDNPTLSRNHHLIIIKQIEKYLPVDLYDYAIEILYYIKEKNALITINNKNIYFNLNNKTYTQMDLNIYTNVLNMMAKKYVPIDNFSYTSILSKEEFVISNKRLFNRILEKTNYCFICEEDDKNKLTLIRLSTNCSQEEIYDISNYFILCKDHAELYNNGQLIIKNNGYPYINNKRLYQHIEINILKNIRKYLKN